MKTLYIGTEYNPEDRIKIDVTEDDYNRIHSASKPFTVMVTDVKTGHLLYISDEDFGLGCRCALRFNTELL